MCDRLSAALAAIVCCSLVFSSAKADNWNTGTGGNSARNSLVMELGPRTPQLLWQGGEPAKVSQQAVVDAELVVMARMQSIDDTLGGTHIVAHDLRTGSVRWSTSLPIDSIDSDWRSRVSAISNGLVFATRAGNINPAHLYALRVADGSIAWRSADRIDESSAESLAFTNDGDLIVGNSDMILRIRAADGTTAWSAKRTCPTSDAAAAAVYGDRIYIWEMTPIGPRVTALDAATGARRYSTAGIGGGFIQQTGLMVGPDGTIYAPRNQNNELTDFLVAFADNGFCLVERWRIPLGYVPSASLGVGPDGSVYAYSRSRELVRIDSASGEVTARSEPIQTDAFQPRLAIGADGILYLTNGGFDQGRLFSFNPDLTTRWSVPVPNVNTGGPALGPGGILVVCGTGTDVQAFASPTWERCAPDWNHDGELDSRDIFDFLADFFAGHADFNHDGVTDSLDLYAFLTPYFTGC